MMPGIRVQHPSESVFTFDRNRRSQWSGIRTQVQFAVLAREAVPARSRQTFTLLCDEVQNLAENDLATLVTEGRKFGVSVVTANQFWEQLPRELRGCLLSAATHICFRVSSQDAHVLAPELSLERRTRLTQDLTQLQRGEAIGRFGSHGVMRFRVPPLASVSAVTSEELEALVAPVTRPRLEIEAELRRATSPPPRAAPFPGTTQRVQEGQHDW